MTPYGTPQLLDALKAALAEAERLGGSYGICLVDDGGHVLLHARRSRRRPWPPRTAR